MFSEERDDKLVFAPKINFALSAPIFSNITSQHAEVQNSFYSQKDIGFSL